MERTCVDCGSCACRGKGGEFPEFCLTAALPEGELAASLEKLSGEDNALAVASARNEADGYCVRCRVEEVMHLCRLMGWRKVGVAFCVGLSREARAFARVLRAHGYEVFGVACKCGAVEKTEIGAPEECLAVGRKLCNPVLQAMTLNRENTDFNVAVGLCVGHDSLFYKYARAPVTTLIAKDRLLGHNPAAALYLLDGYWKKLLEPSDYLDAPGSDL